MALPQSTQTDYLPIMKYDSKSGRFYRRNRIQTETTWETEEVEIPVPFAFLADFQSLEIGWCDLHVRPPSFHLMPYPLGNQLQGIAPNVGPRPDQTHKSTFRILIVLRENAEAVPEIRHFAHGALTVYRAFSGLHDEFLGTEHSKDYTKIPVVMVSQIDTVKSKHGSLYAPVWHIVKWVDRPDELNDYLPHEEDAAGDAREPEAGAGQDLPF